MTNNETTTHVEGEDGALYADLFALHQQCRVYQGDPRDLRHEQVVAILHQMATDPKRPSSPQQLRLQQLGESFEGRSIHIASIGCGPTSVLMWTQMHGDEPTHTAVVLDLLNLFLHYTEDRITQLLEQCTFHIVPMLNPDGVERWTRANAQGIDINRDAIDLESPEGCLLRDVVMNTKPDYGFNLHNQQATKLVSSTRRVAAVSVLAPPLPPESATTSSFIRAKQLAIKMFDIAEQLAPGHVSRYEAGYMPTAFGEWVQEQGVATALLEAGGMPSGRSQDGVSIHFIVLLSALLSIANGDLENLDVARYESLPLSSTS